jgi:hypothetical protein
MEHDKTSSKAFVDSWNETYVKTHDDQQVFWEITNAGLENSCGSTHSRLISNAFQTCKILALEFC